MISVIKSYNIAVSCVRICKTSHFSDRHYVEDSIPATVYLALKYHDDFRTGLIVNTNLGGENAGRGAILGALLGAANGLEAIPAAWISGLKHPPPMLKTAMDPQAADDASP